MRLKDAKERLKKIAENAGSDLGNLKSNNGCYPNYRLIPMKIFSLAELIILNQKKKKSDYH